MTQAHPPVTTSDPVDAVKQWFALMGRYCASVDYDAAESIVAEDVASFGTATDIVSGRTALREGQWESIWGNITDFKMDLDNVYARGSSDQAWGMVTWTFHRLRQRSQAVPSSRTCDHHTRTARRNLARCAHPLLPVPRHSTAHLRHGGVAASQIV